MPKGIPKDFWRKRLRRMYASIDFTTTCWNWRLRLSNKGYALTSLHGRSIVAHRFIYELLIGPIALISKLSRTVRMFCVAKGRAQ